MEDTTLELSLASDVEEIEQPVKQDVVRELTALQLALIGGGTLSNSFI
jgi:hypothetical protein